jgi:hypothetical protein
VLLKRSFALEVSPSDGAPVLPATGKLVINRQLVLPACCRLVQLVGLVPLKQAALTTGARKQWFNTMDHKRYHQIENTKGTHAPMVCSVPGGA